MTISSVADLVEMLRQLRLLAAEQLDEVGRSLAARATEARALAKDLILRGWLTPYQVNQIFLGRGPELVLGQYILLERLGEGGMGQVFKARHLRMDRLVAIKVIRKEKLEKPEADRRFRREIMAVSSLSHPNVVVAFDADAVGNSHFFVMEYVEGIDLAKVLKDSGPLPVKDACSYARQAGLALQHAHERGMVHRDIKPANLLLTTTGVIKVLDMGLARFNDPTDGTSLTHLTHEGVVVGTVDYLAPEQALDSHGVDIRADLYSLGCTFYQMLTGQVPFPTGPVMEKLFKHRGEEPTPVEKLRPEVPRGVAAVVRKLMAKKPEDRYQTPAELVAALTPGSGARPTSPAETPAPARPNAHGSGQRRAAPASGPRRSVKSNPATPAVKPAVKSSPKVPAVQAKPTPTNQPTVPAVAAVPQPGGWSDVVSPLADARRRGPAAKPRRSRLALYSLLGLLLVMAVVAVILVLVLSRPQPQPVADDSGNPADADNALDNTLKALLARHDAGQASADEARQALLDLRRQHPGTLQARRAGEVLMTLPSPLDSLRIQPRLPENLLPRLGELPRELVQVLGRPKNRFEGPLYSIAFSPDDRLLAAAGQEAVVRLWETAGTRLEPKLLTGHNGQVPALAFSPDGKWLASGSHDRTVKIWEVPAGTFRTTLDVGDLVRAVAFAPDGKTLAAACEGGVVRLWEMPSGKPRPACPGHGAAVRDVGFAPGGKALAACAGQTVRVWDWDRAEPKVLATYPTAANRVAFAPDGQTLAVAADGEALLLAWSGTDLKDRQRLKGPRGRLDSVAFTPDGKTLVGHDEEGHVLFWDLPGGTAHEWKMPSGLGALALANDGRHLATAHAISVACLFRIGPPAKR